jgi:hypothetical protein
LSGLIGEGQKGALYRELEEEIPFSITLPDENREHSKEDSRFLCQRIR